MLACLARAAFLSLALSVAPAAAKAGDLADFNALVEAAAAHNRVAIFYLRTGNTDLAGLEQLLLRLSRMAADLPQLAEADFNPVLATPESVTVLDARVRLVPRAPQDPYLRRLR